MERQFRSKEFELEDVKKLLSSVATAAPASTMDELHREISVCFLDSCLLAFLSFLLSRVSREIWPA